MNDQEFESLTPVINELREKYGITSSIRVQTGGEKIHKFHSPSLKFPFDMVDPITGDEIIFTVDDVLRQEAEFCAEKFYGRTIHDQMAEYTDQIVREVKKLLFLRRKGKPVEIPAEITAIEVKIKLK